MTVKQFPAIYFAFGRVPQMYYLVALNARMWVGLESPGSSHHKPMDALGSQNHDFIVCGAAF